MQTVMREGDQPLPLKSTRCIDGKEAETANGSADDIRKALMAEATGCTLEDVTASGDRVTFRQTCGPVRQSAEFSYRGTTMEGRITMSFPGKPPGTMTSQGKRIGACP